MKTDTIVFVCGWCVVSVALHRVLDDKFPSVPMNSAEAAALWFMVGVMTAFLFAVWRGCRWLFRQVTGGN